MALSRKFIWVEVDRDKNPKLVEKFNMSAYPSLVTIGAKHEKIQRFSGFLKPKEFMDQLEDALKRYQLYRDGKEWDTPDPRPGKLCDGAVIETFKAPSTGASAGFAMIAAELWLGQAGKLTKLDPKTGEVKATFNLPEATMDLCTDGKVLYAVPSSWTAGAAIREIDPATGKVTREIVTEANTKNKHSGANGIEFIDGKLIVLEGMMGLLHTVDPASGEIVATVKSTERWLGGLAFDGTNFVVGSRTHLVWMSPKGEVVKKVAVNYPVRSVGFAEGVVYVMEQPIFGFDKEHQSVQLWPKETNIYRLTFGK